MLCAIGKENCRLVENFKVQAASGELPNNFIEECIRCGALAICRNRRVEVQERELVSRVFNYFLSK